MEYKYIVEGTQPAHVIFAHRERELLGVMDSVFGIITNAKTEQVRNKHAWPSSRF